MRSNSSSSSFSISNADNQIFQPSLAQENQSLPQVYIFCHPSRSKPIIALEDALRAKSISYILHYNQDSFARVLGVRGQRQMIIVQNEKGFSTNKFFQSKQSSTRIYAYPTPLKSSSFVCLSTPKEVIQQYHNFNGNSSSSSRFQMNNVRSLSKDKITPFNQPLLKTSYKEVYYQTGLQKYSCDHEYFNLVNQLISCPDAIPFSEASMLDLAQKGKEKNLIITNTCTQGINTFKKVLSKSKNYDFVFCGNLQTAKEIFEPRVALATPMADRTLYFLKEHTSLRFKKRDIAKISNKKENKQKAAKYYEEDPFKVGDQLREISISEQSADCDFDNFLDQGFADKTRKISKEVRNNQQFLLTPVKEREVEREDSRRSKQMEESDIFNRQSNEMRMSGNQIKPKQQNQIRTSNGKKYAQQNVARQSNQTNESTKNYNRQSDQIRQSGNKMQQYQQNQIRKNNHKPEIKSNVNRQSDQKRQIDKFYNKQSNQIRQSGNQIQINEQNQLKKIDNYKEIEQYTIRQSDQIRQSNNQMSRQNQNNLRQSNQIRQSNNQMSRQNQIRQSGNQYNRENKNDIRQSNQIRQSGNQISRQNQNNLRQSNQIRQSNNQMSQQNQIRQSGNQQSRENQNDIRQSNQIRQSGNQISRQNQNNLRQSNQIQNNRQSGQSPLRQSKNVKQQQQAEIRRSKQQMFQQVTNKQQIFNGQARKASSNQFQFLPFDEQMQYDSADKLMQQSFEESVSKDQRLNLMQNVIAPYVYNKKNNFQVLPNHISELSEEYKSTNRIIQSKQAIGQRPQANFQKKNTSVVLNESVQNFIYARELKNFIDQNLQQRIIQPIQSQKSLANDLKNIVQTNYKQNVMLGESNVSNEYSQKILNLSLNNKQQKQRTNRIFTPKNQQSVTRMQSLNNNQISRNNNEYSNQNVNPNARPIINKIVIKYQNPPSQGQIKIDQSKKINRCMSIDSYNQGFKKMSYHPQSNEKILNNQSSQKRFASPVSSEHNQNSYRNKLNSQMQLKQNNQQGFKKNKQQQLYANEMKTSKKYQPLQIESNKQIMDLSPLNQQNSAQGRTNNHKQRDQNFTGFRTTNSGRQVFESVNQQIMNKQNQRNIAQQSMKSQYQQYYLTESQKKVRSNVNMIASRNKNNYSMQKQYRLSNQSTENLRQSKQMGQNQQRLQKQKANLSYSQQKTYDTIRHPLANAQDYRQKQANKVQEDKNSCCFSSFRQKNNYRSGPDLHQILRQQFAKSDPKQPQLKNVYQNNLIQQPVHNSMQNKERQIDSIKKSKDLSTNQNRQNQSFDFCLSPISGNKEHFYQTQEKQQYFHNPNVRKISQESNENYAGKRQKNNLNRSRALNSQNHGKSQEITSPFYQVSRASKNRQVVTVQQPENLQYYHTPTAQNQQMLTVNYGQNRQSHDIYIPKFSQQVIPIGNSSVRSYEQLNINSRQNISKKKTSNQIQKPINDSMQYSDSFSLTGNQGFFKRKEGQKIRIVPQRKSIKHIDMGDFKDLQQRSKLTPIEEYAPQFNEKSTRARQMASGSIGKEKQKKIKDQIIVGSTKIAQENWILQYIEPKNQEFIFLVEESLFYVQRYIEENLLGSSKSVIQKWSQIDELYSKIESSTLKFGIVFASNSNKQRINANALPPKYLIVSLEHSPRNTIEVNQKQKTIQIDSLGNIRLVQKIIIDSALCKYVLYSQKTSNFQKLIEPFSRSQEYNLIKYSNSLSCEQLTSCVEVGALARVWIICQQEDLPHIERTILKLQSKNAAFKRNNCRVLCSAQKNQGYRQSVRGLEIAFIPVGIQFRSCAQIINYQAEQEIIQFIPTEFLFYSRRLSKFGLRDAIADQYPSRFQLIGYESVASAQRQANNIMQERGEYGLATKAILVLHDSEITQNIKSRTFDKVILFSRLKNVPIRILRGQTCQEIVQILREI